MDPNILSSPTSAVPAPLPTVTTTTPIPVPGPEQNVMQESTSGMGNQSIVPDEIKGWSWGGFLWNWIWAIGNKTWIGLLAIIPFFTLIMAIILGIKGREWAWKNKHWDSIEAFNKTQRNWVKWYLIIYIPLTILLTIIGIIFGVVLVAINPQQQIQIANCVKNCQTASDVPACTLKCQIEIKSAGSDTSSEVSGGGINTATLIPTILPTPTSIPTTKPTTQPTKTSKPTVLPTSVPTSIPTNVTPTNAPSTNFQSTGVQNLENGVTAIAPSASLSSGVVTTSITFKNTSTTTQNTKAVRLQMHDQNLGTATREGYVGDDIGPGQSKTYNVSFNALPNPPYKIEFALQNGDLVNLGTYTP